SGLRADVAEGLLAAAESVALRVPSPEPAMLAALDWARAIRAALLGDRSAYIRFMAMSADSSERAGDVRTALGARINLAFGHLQVGAYAVAERMLRTLLAEAERMGVRDVAAYARQNLALALAHQGSLDEADEMLAPALSMAVAKRQRRLEGGCRMYNSMIRL